MTGSSQRRSRGTGGGARKLPSGRWQVRVNDRATGQRVVVGVFPTKADADLALAQALADQSRGGWVPPDRGRLKVSEYAARWMDEHPRLAPTTRDLYRGLLTRHILPQLGDAAIGDLTPAGIKTWYARLGRTTGDPSRAKAYRLLRAILAGAVDDGLLVRNPAAAVKGAGVERPAERPIATVPQVFALADAVPARWRCVILLGAFASMRLGEIAGLRRRDVDLVHGRVRVERQIQRLDDGTYVTLEPKQESRRTVTLPTQIADALTEHLHDYVGPARDDLLFHGPLGTPLSRHAWGRVWRAARDHVAEHDASLPDGLRFHDLRHTGNTMSAATGASTRELMARMGHRSSRAALLYQHATQDRDDAIARGLGDLIERAAPTPTASRERPGLAR